MNKSQLRKIALGDIEFMLNNDFLSALGSRFSVVDVKQDLLNHRWNISSRTNLLETLTRLESSGYSNQYLSVRKNGPITEFEQEFVSRYADDIGDRALKAWDLSRLITLCRWGLYVGYLEEGEFWQWLDKTALTLSSLYSSWDEFAEHFNYGSQFWSESFEEEEKTYVRYFLSRSEKSPWRSIPWNSQKDEGSTQTSSESDGFVSPFCFDAALKGKQRELELQKHLLRLLDANPDNPSLLVDLGELYSPKFGWGPLAKQLFVKALKLNPAHAAARENLRRLKLSRIGGLVFICFISVMLVFFLYVRRF